MMTWPHRSRRLKTASAASRADPSRGLRACSAPVLIMRRCAGCPEHSPRLRSWPDAGRDGCHLSSERCQSACYLRLTADIMPPPLLARVVVAGTQSAAPAAAHRCAQLQALQTQRAEICAEIEQRVAAHPRCPILTGQTCVGPPHPAAPGGDPAVRIAARL